MDNSLSNKKIRYLPRENDN